MCSAMDQPTILRVNKSSTAHTYSQPSRVQIYVMSDNQTWSGALACEADAGLVSQLKSWPSKLGETGSECAESVVTLNFLPALAHSPMARINDWMRFKLPV